METWTSLIAAFTLAGIHLFAGHVLHLAGGIVLDVLEEELPGERESRFGAFFLGIVGYGVLLQMGRA